MGKFLSTPSARRATYWSALNILSYRYFYPRPPRGGRLQKQAFNLQSRIISIHALREEGDNVERLFVQERFGHFYPRPPRGATRKLLGQSSPCSSFLSTPSARRATEDGDVAHHTVVISIHALREEGDFWTSMC